MHIRHLYHAILIVVMQSQTSFIINLGVGESIKLDEHIVIMRIDETHYKLFIDPDNPLDKHEEVEVFIVS